MRSSKKPSNYLPFLIIGLGVLVVAAALLWAAQLSRSPAPTAESEELTPFPEIARISLQDAYTAHQKKQALFIDVRSAENYQQSHVAGAINIPIAELENRYRELDPNQWIITYCT